MARKTRKNATKTRKTTRKTLIDSTSPAPTSIHSIAAPITPLRSLNVQSGARPDAETVLYVHGIGNKPKASVLKCQWDDSLFGREMGDRTRLAYWVDRDRYLDPEEADCGAADTIRVETDGLFGVGIKTVAEGRDEIEDEITRLTADPARREWLRKLAESRLVAEEQAVPEAQKDKYGTRVLPLPEFARRLVTRVTTRIFLRDVNDFFFEPGKRQTMLDSVVERLEAGGGPFVVISHSQGSMIAYEVLRQLDAHGIEVPLFVTIGSPLGLTEVKDIFRKWSGVNRGKLPFPACVDRWVNVADRLDPVAFDSRLANDFAGSIEDYSGFFENQDSPKSSHSATGYLRNQNVQRAVKTTVGNAFQQALGGGIVARDLVESLEDGNREERHPVLIQLSDSTGAAFLDDNQPGERVETAVRELLVANGVNPAHVPIDRLKRFVAVDLARLEIETLRTRHDELSIRRVWRNAPKRALMHRSTHTVQARPAQLGYDSRGRAIRWAVLDTGIRADHPHFSRHGNVKRQWDCTTAGQPPIEVPAGTDEFHTLDRQGHGTHVAAVIAGRMTVTDANGQEVDMCGMAPETELFGFKVLDDDGNGNDASIIKALDLIADLNDTAPELVIHGVNLSLGGNFDSSVYGCGHTPLCQELRRLWRQGVIVCLAAGNEGWAMLRTNQGMTPANMDLSIGDPANLEEAIAVGSVHKERPHTYGISYFSSRGPTADGRRKPDLVAPGEDILSAYAGWRATGGNEELPQLDQLYISLSGTSMATPHVSGILAAFLSARREFIGYSDRIKQILFDNCTDLGRDPYMQGSGLPNLIQMLANT